MSSELIVPIYIKDFIQEIIEKYNLDSSSQVKYNVGSEAGDGYLSKTLAVDIIGENKSLNIFLKYALTIKSNVDISFDVIYKNECYFFDSIYTEFRKFAESKGIENALNYVPKCYGTSPKHIIALENLKVRGFEMFDRKRIMNDAHILSILTLYAEYHAISLAMRDQVKEEYIQIVDSFMPLNNNNSQMAQMITGMFNDFISTLNQSENKLILNKSDILLNKLLDCFKEEFCEINEYSVITKGDCWNNNMMFLYKDEEKETPSEIMLVDWQLIKHGSLVLDLSSLFYTVANKEKLSKLNFYLEEYHKELSKNLQKLGSDPEIIYPYSIFEKEWKEYCVYGYMMAFVIIKVMLVSKEDVPDMENMDMDSENGASDFFSMKSNQEYYDRMKILTEHMIENNFI